MSISRRHRSQNCSWLRLNVERVKYIGKKFWTTKDRYKEHPECEFRLCILSNRITDGQQYNIPTTSKVARLIVGDLTEENFQRDIIVK